MVCVAVVIHSFFFFSSGIIHSFDLPKSAKMSAFFSITFFLLFSLLARVTILPSKSFLHFNFKSCLFVIMSNRQKIMGLTSQ